MEDESIVIGTRLTTDKFDKQIAQLEKKINQREQKKLKIQTEIEDIRQKANDFNELIAKAEEYKRVVDKINETQQQRSSQGLKPLTLTAGAQQLVNDYQEMEKYINSNASGMQKMADKGNLLIQEYQELNKEIKTYKSEIDNVDLQRQIADTEKLKDGFSNVTNSIESAAKRAGKLVLGIFGIRSAYMALRRASSDLASYDQQYAANLEYIRFVLTQMIAPVLRWIVGLAGTLLSYLYAILNAWFGIGKKIDVGAKSFQKMKAGAGGVSKAVKELKKQLVGFDELNVLTGQGDVGAGGGVGTTMPNFDVGGDIKIPSWLQWIIDNKDTVLSVLAGIVAGIIALKAGLGGIKALGIGLIVAGIVSLVKDVIKFIKDPSWSNFAKILKDLAIILAGVALVTGKWEFAVAGLALAIAGILIELYQKENAVLSVKTAQEQLKKSTEELNKAENAYIDAVDRAEEALRLLKEAEDRTGLSGEELNKQVEAGILDYKNMTAEQREVYKAYINSKNAQDNLSKSTETLIQKTAENKQMTLQERLATMLATGAYDDYKKAVVDAYNDGTISAQEASRLIGKALGEIDRDSWETFMEDLPNDVKEGLNPSTYQYWAARFTNWWNNTFIGGLIKDLKLKLNANVSAGGGAGGGSSSGGGRAMGGIFYPSKLPRLASGGIVNFPGRGALYNGAYIGERGAEAVVPLTDSQQMELLGATIGKYITVNANIVNSMNGRVISRELKQVKSEQDFAYNT